MSNKYIFLVTFLTNSFAGKNKKSNPTWQCLATFSESHQNSGGTSHLFPKDLATATTMKNTTSLTIMWKAKYVYVWVVLYFDPDFIKITLWLD